MRRELVHILRIVAPRAEHSEWQRHACPDLERCPTVHEHCAKVRHIWIRHLLT